MTVGVYILEWLEAKNNYLVLWRILTSGEIQNDMHISKRINNMRTMLQCLIHTQSLVPTHAQKCCYLRLTDYLGISPRSKAFESPNLHVPEYMCSEKWGTLKVHLTDAGNMEHTAEQGKGWRRWPWLPFVHGSNGLSSPSGSEFAIMIFSYQ